MPSSQLTTTPVQVEAAILAFFGEDPQIAYRLEKGQVVETILTMGMVSIDR